MYENDIIYLEKKIILTLKHFTAPTFISAYFSDCWKDAKNPSLLRPSGRFGDYQCDASVDLGPILRNSIPAAKKFRINFHPQILDKFPPKNHRYEFS
jgi:hypothetical protein